MAVPSDRSTATVLPIDRSADRAPDRSADQPLTGELIHARGARAALPAVPDREHAVSARAAFQELLARRAVLVDLRSARQRAQEGAVEGGLPVVVWSDGPPAGLAEVVAPGTRLVLLGPAGGLLLASLRAHGFADVVSVDGGFAAWRAAGMPTAA
ncbi:hypothetical protein GCM10022215_18540 [Nocardioides fonticola]|uniref:Rhodanese domain-containing protein n=1 Tax=Nocardioides fonticola TaxID=450363 RepID=A0ABP7XHR2_9ACTN